MRQQEVFLGKNEATRQSTSGTMSPRRYSPGAPTSHNEEITTSTSVHLDAVRGLAALAVMTFHCSGGLEGLSVGMSIPFLHTIRTDQGFSLQDWRNHQSLSTVLMITLSSRTE
jgi:hypothetical protein